MIDYRNMSDGEINALVGINLGVKVGEPINGIHLIEVDGGYISSSFDPCHNPADAWPIIYDNGISLYHDNGYWEAEFTYEAPVGAFGTDETCSKFFGDKNPLRAAMIAFLMMKQSE